MGLLTGIGLAPNIGLQAENGFGAASRKQ